MVVDISTKPESKCMKERNMTQWAFRKYNNKETAYVKTFSKAYSIRYAHTHNHIYIVHMNIMFASIQYSISYDFCQISLDTTMNELYV